jgi:hypothetical protein
VSYSALLSQNVTKQLQLHLPKTTVTEKKSTLQMAKKTEFCELVPPEVYARETDFTFICYFVA